MLSSHHLNNPIHPLNLAHTRSGARGASTPLSPVCPAWTAHTRERNTDAPLPNVRSTFQQASVSGSSPTNNTIIRPTPYIPNRKDDQTRNAQHFRPPTNEPGRRTYHGIITDNNLQGDGTHVAGNASDTIVEESRTARLPAAGNEHSNYADANPRSLARLEYSLNGAIRGFEGRNGRPWIHPQQHRSNTDLPETANTPPEAPSQSPQTRFQVSILRAIVWFWTPLLSLLSTILAICLFIKAKTKPWSTSAQRWLLVWMIVSTGILLMSLLTHCRLVQTERGGCPEIEIGPGWRSLSIRPTHARSDEQTAREEGLELSLFDGNNRRRDCELSGRDGGDSRRDEHDGGARPVLLPIRFSLGPRNISGTSGPQANIPPNSTSDSGSSDSGSSMHPGFKTTDPLSLLPYTLFPKAAAIHTSSGLPQFKHSLNGFNQTRRPSSTKVDHKRARHPPLLGQSNPNLITQEQLLQFQKEQDEIREGYRQEQQQVRRKACLNSKQRPDTPRVKMSTLITRTCSDISPIGEVQTPIVVPKTRGPRVWISGPASRSLRTSSTPVSPLVVSTQRVHTDDIGEEVIPAAADADSPIAAMEDRQHERLTHEQMPAVSRHQQLSDTRISEGRNMPVPPIPHEYSHVPNYPSPPSSYGGSVIRYPSAQVSAEGSEHSTGFPISDREQDDAADVVPTYQTPPALSESVVELDRHLRNSGSVELNKFLTDISEDRYPETHPSSLDQQLKQRCRGRTRERGWFHAHLSQCRNLSTIEDTELDLDAEIRAAQEDAWKIPYSFRAASAQSLTPRDTSGREVSIKGPSSPAPSRSSCSSSQSLDEHIEHPLEVPVAHAEHSETQNQHSVLEGSQGHHHLPPILSLKDQNNEKASHETLESTKESRLQSPAISPRTRLPRRNAVTYSPASAPLFSYSVFPPISSLTPRHIQSATQAAQDSSQTANNQGSHSTTGGGSKISKNHDNIEESSANPHLLHPRSANRISASAQERDAGTYEGVAATRGGMNWSRRGHTDCFVVSGRGEAGRSKEGKINGGLSLEEQRDEYGDKENVVPSDVGVAW